MNTNLYMFWAKLLVKENIFEERWAIFFTAKVCVGVNKNSGSGIRATIFLTTIKRIHECACRKSITNCLLFTPDILIGQPSR